MDRTLSDRPMPSSPRSVRQRKGWSPERSPNSVCDRCFMLRRTRALSLRLPPTRAVADHAPPRPSRPGRENDAPTTRYLNIKQPLDNAVQTSHGRYVSTLIRAGASPAQERPKTKHFGTPATNTLPRQSRTLRPGTIPGRSTIGLLFNVDPGRRIRLSSDRQPNLKL